MTERFGMTSDVAIAFIFFYATQCTGPTRFISTLTEIMKNKSLIRECYSPKSSMTLYQAMVDECKRVRPNVTTSVGSDGKNRYQASHQQPLSPNRFKITLQSIKAICQEFRTKWLYVKSSSNNVEGKLERITLAHQLTRKLFKVQGCGEVCGRVFYVLLVYVNLLPLPFELCMPLHKHGGTGHFLEQYLEWDFSMSTTDFNRKSAHLWHLFTVKFSPYASLCLLEQALCQVSREIRKKMKSDLFLSLERHVGGIISSDSKRLISASVSDPSCLQKFYYMDGKAEGALTLKVFDGEDSTVVFSHNPSVLGACCWDDDFEHLLLNYVM